MAVKDCPCHSGARYAVCCKPLHEGAPATSPVTLMRSRFSAFALGLGDYLVDTLARDHHDRQLPREALARELGRAKERQRFLDLEIWWSSPTEVLFFAKIFERGQDRSFAELSTFVDENGFRYQGGVLVPRSRLPAKEPLDRDRFLTIASKEGQ